MCEPEQETSESRSQRHSNDKFLSPTGTRNSSSKASGRLSRECHLLAKFLSQGAAFTAIVAFGEIAGYAGYQELCETIHALSALSQ
jgi:hypothetical protein